MGEWVNGCVGGGWWVFRVQGRNPWRRGLPLNDPQHSEGAHLVERSETGDASYVIFENINYTYLFLFRNEFIYYYPI